MGYVNRYDATAGGLTVALPALSGQNVGARTMLQKYKLDSSSYTVTFNRAGSDQFDDGSTSLVLSYAGESRTLQVVLIGGVKRWKIMEAMGETPPSGGGGGGGGGSDVVTVNFVDVGVCDGVTNDAAAFAAALSTLSSAGGGILLLPPKTIAMTVTAFPTFNVPGNVKIVGTPGATRILLTSNSSSADRALMKTAGDNVTIDGVKFVRNADFPLVFFFPGPYNGFHLRNCVIDGQQNSYPAQYVHGIDLDDSTGTKGNITVKNCKITRVWFGLLQSNSVTTTVDTITVDDCTFTANFRDDLCFNAPNSLMKDVSVVNSHFRDNVTTDPSAGFGVDFAHVTSGTVHNCYFENYSYEAIHVEDYSTGVVVSDNRLVSCGKVDEGGILVMTGSSDVVIVGNTIDATSNTNTDMAIGVLQAGSGTTPGGRASIPPSSITIASNIIRCGAKFVGIYVENAPNIVIQGNQIYGAGAVSAGVWNAGNLQTGILIDGQATVIDGNTVKGFLYGIGGPLNTRVILGDPGQVKGNVITDCYVGVLASSPGNLTISANTMSNCVRPLIVGEGGVTAKPCSVVGNSAFGCVYRMEISGKLILNRPADPAYQYTVATGTGRSIYVDNNLLKLPVGTVINFAPSGAVFTLTTAITTARPNNAFPWELVGDVTVATVGATDVGTTTNLAHSTTSANNHVMVANNLDTVAGVYT